MLISERNCIFWFMLKAQGMMKLIRGSFTIKRSAMIGVGTVCAERIGLAWALKKILHNVYICILYMNIYMYGVGAFIRSLNPPAPLWGHTAVEVISDLWPLVWCSAVCCHLSY